MTERKEAAYLQGIGVGAALVLGLTVVDNPQWVYTLTAVLAIVCIISGYIVDR